MPKLSAIMPTYNRALFLPEAIESIRIQKFKDWELIVVDDGSTDSTKDLMEWYAKEDSRIKYFRRDKNKGIAVSRNEAIEKANADKIIICDSDDIQLESRFQKVIKHWGKNKDLDLIYHSFFHCDANLRIHAHVVAMPFRMDKLFEAQYIGQPTLAFKKKVWEKVPYNEKLKYGEDWEFLIKCGLEGFKFGWIKKPMVKYREHEQGTSIQKRDIVNRYDKKMVKRLKKQWLKS